MKNKNTLYSLLSIGIFAIIALIYFSPTISGKRIIQHDITQFRGANEEVSKFKSETGELSYWTNSMFSGMPTFQSGAEYPNDFLRTIDTKIIRFLPSPADYVILLFAGFFFLIMVWLKNWKYALLGATMFAFSTYFFIIIGAGHNAKVHTIAYFAPLVAGIYLLYEKKYIWGFITTTLFLGLQLAANHPQMTYYLFLAMISFGVIKLIAVIKNKEFKDLGIATSLLVLATILALGMNSSRYLATYQYTKETTRGKSDLTIQLNKEGKVVKKENTAKKKGLDPDYITNWSYGKLETLNLFIPNFMGGGNNEKAFEPKNFQEEIQYMGENGMIKSEEQYQKLVSAFAGSYWGEQPGTSGPAYQGAIIIFLAILGLFFYQEKYKWWLISATILSIILAWGKNFSILTDFMIDYFPLYNKFRAVSSILVIAEFTLPLLAVLGLYSFFKNENLTADYKKKILFLVGGVTLLFLLILYFFGGNILDFHNEKEGAIMSDNLLEALKKDRISLFKSDVLRTLFFVLITLVLLISFQFKKIKTEYVIVFALTILCLLDLWTVNKRYLNDENFVAAKIAKNPFLLSPIENTDGSAVLQQLSNQAPINKALYDLQQHDKTQYRVFNTLMGIDENTTGYFHQNIGGYHAAKLSRYQDILDFYIAGRPNIEVLNMLNTKYIILADSTKIDAQINPYNNGNAWYVQKIQFTKNPNDEIVALGKIDSKKTAIVDEKDKKYTEKLALGIDSSAFIKLENYRPNQLRYSAETKENQFAVFSEIYYPYGWNAFIDGEKAEYIRCNYTLRGLVIPKGKHTIEFKFEPTVVATGGTISLISFIAFLMISIGALLFYFKKSRN